MSAPRLTAVAERANDVGVRCALRRFRSAHRHRRATAGAITSCAKAACPARAARAAQAVTLATPQSEGLVRVRGRVCLRTTRPRPPGVASVPAVPPGRVFGPMRPWTLVLIGVALTALAVACVPRAVPRSGRQPVSGPDRPPRSGPAPGDPPLVLPRRPASPCCSPAASRSRSRGSGSGRSRGAGTGAGCRSGPSRPRTTRPRS